MNTCVNESSQNVEVGDKVIDGVRLESKPESGDVDSNNEVHSFINIKNILFLLAIMAVLLVGLVLTLYFTHFDGEFSKSNDDWGTFGDFVGGTLNPILAFFSFVALLITLVMQSKQLELSSKELSATRKELERTAQAQEDSYGMLIVQNKTQIKQQFENTFFSILHQLNIIGEQVRDLKDGGNSLNGKSVLTSCIEWVDAMHHFHKEINLDTCQGEIVSDAPMVNQYFKVLYQALKFIESNEPDIKGKTYSNLIRSMIPDHVLMLLWFHCAVGPSDPFYAFKLLLQKYSFFEHLYWDGYFSGYAEGFNEVLIQHYSSEAYGKSVFVKHPDVI